MHPDRPGRRGHHGGRARPALGATQLALHRLYAICDEHLFASKLSKLKDVLALRDNLLKLGLQVSEQGSEEDDPPYPLGLCS